MRKKWLLTLSGSLLAAMIVTGCTADDEDPAPPENNPTEENGEMDTEQPLEDAGENVEEGLEEGGDMMEEGANEGENMLEEGTDEANDMMEEGNNEGTQEGNNKEDENK